MNKAFVHESIYPKVRLLRKMDSRGSKDDLGYQVHSICWQKSEICSVPSVVNNQ